MFYNEDMTCRGVNLGGWLVAEKWMTPSLFSGTTARNEYQLAASEDGRRRLQAHHAHFITESDIAWLADQRVELLRIPVGHWIFGDVPPYVGAIDRLDWIVATAKRHGMKILIDLHGAPDAQNTRDHSGSGNQPHDTAWLKNRSAQDRTIKILCRLARRYRQERHIWGIELLNEPTPGPTGVRLAWFYRRAYRELAKVARPGTYIVFSDGFRPWLLAGTFLGMTKRDFPVVMDCHLYQCFGRRNKARSFESHLRLARSKYWYLRLLSWVQPVMVGEWSGMLPTPVGESRTRQYIDVQQAAFRPALAHCYWSYTTEGGGRWSFRHTFTGMPRD